MSGVIQNYKVNSYKWLHLAYNFKIKNVLENSFKFFFLVVIVEFIKYVTDSDPIYLLESPAIHSRLHYYFHLIL
jgi:hypothetical protein